MFARPRFGVSTCGAAKGRRRSALTSSASSSGNRSTLQPRLRPKWSRQRRGAFVPPDSWPHRTLTGRRRRASLRSRPSNHLLVTGRPSCRARAPRTQPATPRHRSPPVRGNFNGPYPMKIWVHGHDWAERQAAKAGIGLTEQSHDFPHVQRSCGGGRRSAPGSARERYRCSPNGGVCRFAAAHRAGPRRQLLMGSVDAAGGDLTHPGVRCTPARPRVLRGAGHGQPRHRPRRGARKS